MRPVLLVGHADWETFGVVPGTLDAEGLPWIEHLAHTGAVLPDLAEAFEFSVVRRGPGRRYT